MSFATAPIPSRRGEFYSTTKTIPIRPMNTLSLSEQWSWKQLTKHKSLTERNDQEVKTTKSLPFRTDRRHVVNESRKTLLSARPPRRQTSPQSDIWITSKLKYFEQKSMQEACINRIKDLEAQLTEMLHYYKMLYEENSELKKKLNIVDKPAAESFDAILNTRGIMRTAEQNYQRRVKRLEQESRDAAVVQGRLMAERKRVKSKLPDTGKELEKEAMYHKLYWECNTQGLRNESLKKQIIHMEKQMDLTLDRNRFRAIGKLKHPDQRDAENMLIDSYRINARDIELTNKTDIQFKSRTNRFILELQSKINATSLDIEKHTKEMQRLKEQYDKLVDNTANGHVYTIRCERLVRRLREDLGKLNVLKKLHRTQQHK